MDGLKPETTYFYAIGSLGAEANDDRREEQCPAPIDFPGKAGSVQIQPAICGDMFGLEGPPVLMSPVIRARIQINVTGPIRLWHLQPMTVPCCPSVEIDNRPPIAAARSRIVRIPIPKEDDICAPSP
jgi:hypothetical protein